MIRKLMLSLLVLLIPMSAFADKTHDLRVKKCSYIVKTFYDHKGKAAFLPHVEYYISCFEGMEADAVRRGKKAEGFSSAWYWGLVYGGANFSLRCYAVAPGNCAGPMDVKNYPLITDPEENIKHLCSEMLAFYVKGVRGRDLCEHVFLPANPRDWGGGKFRKTDLMFKKALQKGYQNEKF